MFNRYIEWIINSGAAMKNLTLSVILFVVAFIPSLFAQWQHFPLKTGDMNLTLSSVACTDNGEVYVMGCFRFYLLSQNKWTDLTDTTIEYLNMQNNIRDLYYDPQGYIWGSSELGLIRYDIKNKAYKYINLSFPGFNPTHEYVTGLTTDKNGKIWFTSRSTCLAKFDGKTFKDFDLMDKSKILRVSYRQTRFSRGESSKIWMTGDDGVLCFDSDSSEDALKYVKFTLKQMKLDTGASGLVSVTDVKAASDGKIWVADDVGKLSRFNGMEWERISIPDSLMGTPDQYGVNCIWKISENGNGRMLFFWKSAPFFLSYTASNGFSKHYYPLNYPYNVISPISISIDSSDVVWIGTTSDGIFTYDFNSVGVKEYTAESIISEVGIRRVYPNPSSGNVVADLLVYPDNLGSVSIGIYDYLGNKVMDAKSGLTVNTRNGDGLLQFDVSALPSGAYFLCIKKGTDAAAGLIFKK